MRKVIWWMMVSLDGYFEGPDHDLSWHHVDQELHQHLNDAIRPMGALLNGRATWQLMADFWPDVARVFPDEPLMAEYSEIWKTMPKLVYSRTLQEAGWNTTIVRQVDPAEVQALKAQPGGDLCLTAGDLGAEFMRMGLVDEIRLYVNPVVLGRGRLLFGAGVKREWELLETKRFGNGVVMMRYRAAGQ